MNGSKVNCSDEVRVHHLFNQFSGRHVVSGISRRLKLLSLPAMIKQLENV
jgi:hypothetical protein